MFEKLIVTNKGQELLTQILEGDTIEFTSIALGKATSRPSNIHALTALVNLEKSINVERLNQLSSNTINIGGNLKGTDITTAFTWTELGIYAKNVTKSGSPVLFSYQYATTPVPVPVGGTVAELLLDFNINVGTASNVQLTIDSSLIYITQSMLTQNNTNVLTTVDTKISTALTPINNSITELNNHKSSTGNPHSVTKSQVGLGNVENYGIATTVEAKAGTASNKYVTPIRVKEAIEGLSVGSDGNVIIKIQNTQPSPVSGKTVIWIDTSS